MTPLERERVAELDERATRLITRNRRLCKGTVARYAMRQDEPADVARDLAAMLGLDETAHIADALPVSTGFHDSTTALSTADARRKGKAKEYAGRRAFGHSGGER
jgi:hypothetical protein